MRHSNDFGKLACTVGELVGIDAEFLLHGNEKICERSVFGELVKRSVLEPEVSSTGEHQRIVACVMRRASSASV